MEPLTIDIYILLVSGSMTIIDLVFATTAYPLVSQMED
jgi:hypothetical protein